MRKLILFIFCILISSAKAEYKFLNFWVTPKKVTQSFLNLPVNAENVRKCLIYYKVKNIDIVLAQGILESGHFKSNVCIKYNNIFGFMKKRYKPLKFTHWSECVKYYVENIQVRYKPPDENYYQFLKRIKYAHDKHYIHKLKSIINGRNFISKNYSSQSFTQRVKNYSWCLIGGNIKRP